MFDDKSVVSDETTTPQEEVAVEQEAAAQEAAVETPEAVVEPIIDLSAEATTQVAVKPSVEDLVEAAAQKPLQEEVPEVIAVENRVEFEGASVSAVLRDGQELRDTDGHITHYHCSMSDGTTKHVPVSLFK